MPRAARHCLNCHCPTAGRPPDLPSVILSLSDYREARAMVRGASASPARTLLERELTRAVIALPDRMPTDIATLNSRVAYRYSEMADIQVRMLVGPRAAGRRGDTLSILTSVGAALLGLRVGSTLEWREDGVLHSVTVEQVICARDVIQPIQTGSECT